MAKFMQTSEAGPGCGKAGGRVWYNRKGDSTWNRNRQYRGDVAQPRTVRQLRNRAVMRCLVALWKGFSAPDKEYWKEQATTLQSGWNAFCQYNLKQAVEGWMPQQEKSTEHLGTPAAPTALAAEVVDNTIRVTWTDGTLGYTTGLHLGTSAGFTPAMSNLVYCVLATDGDDRQATINVAPGTYYLKARSGDEDGSEGAPTTSVGPLVVG
jgi:hypothetical protein